MWWEAGGGAGVPLRWAGVREAHCEMGVRHLSYAYLDCVESALRLNGLLQHNLGVHCHTGFRYGMAHSRPGPWVRLHVA